VQKYCVVTDKEFAATYLSNLHQNPIQSNEFRRTQAILYARISMSKHLYTKWLTSSSSQVSVKIKQTSWLDQCLSSLFLKVLIV